MTGGGRKSQTTPMARQDDRPNDQQVHDDSDIPLTQLIQLSGKTSEVIENNDEGESKRIS